MFKHIGLLVLLSLLTACYETPQSENFVPVISRKGTKYIPTQSFENGLSPLLQGMTNEVTATLEQHEKTDGMPWKLSRVTVGLGLETEIDLFEVVEGDIEGVLELRFQKI